MKRVFMKRIAAIVLVLAMALSVLSGCGKATIDEAALNEAVSAAVDAALDATTTSVDVTFNVDGQLITVKDAADIRIQELLSQANITLNEGDILSVDPYQPLSGNIAVQILRKNVVSIVAPAEDSDDSITYTVVLYGGSVADALAAAGVELSEDQIIDVKPDQMLENGMKIVVSSTVEKEEATEEVEEETEEETQSQPTPTAPPATKPSSSSTTPTSAPKPTTPPTTPPTTAPKPTTPSKTVVSIEVYEDCDGSGHGVKIITYSDGSQEEVPF